MGAYLRKAARALDGLNGWREQRALRRIYEQLGQYRCVLELGCGPEPHIGHSLRLDNQPQAHLPGLIVQDITQPWKIPTCPQVILAEHVLEHLTGRQIMGVLEQAWLLLDPPGYFFITVPAAHSRASYRDLTHEWTHWHADSFRAWEPGVHAWWRSALLGLAGAPARIKARFILCWTRRSPLGHRWYMLKKSWPWD